jgi:hypothetical protein
MALVPKIALHHRALQLCFSFVNQELLPEALLLQLPIEYRLYRVLQLLGTINRDNQLEAVLAVFCVDIHSDFKASVLYAISRLSNTVIKLV